MSYSLHDIKMVESLFKSITVEHALSAQEFIILCGVISYCFENDMRKQTPVNYANAAERLNVSREVAKRAMISLALRGILEKEASGYICKLQIREP